MSSNPPKRVFVTGATGFIGRALVPSLRARQWEVIGASRHAAPSPSSGIEWRVCDLLRPETLTDALVGAHVAYFLVHSMGERHTDFRERDRRAARNFADAAAKADVRRIVYLGGPAPLGSPSEHLASRLEVGEILRAGAVPTVELRASMVIGSEGASWRIVRDLAMRLPTMVLPRWLRSRTRPVALEDAVIALVEAAEVPIERSTWFDIPGPETVTGRELLERIAALRGRRILKIEVPLLTPHLSALWLRLVARTDFALARELVVGLHEDLLPKDDRYWELIGHTALVPLDVAARRALEAEPAPHGVRERLADLEERLATLVALKVRTA